MIQEIFEEWRVHQSKYSAIWLRRMFGRRQVDYEQSARDHMLRARIDDSLCGNQRVIDRKDVHLVEAALATDRLVASRDEKARGAFRDAAALVQELKGIVWINPTLTADAPIHWLRSGADTEAHRKLGAQ